MGAVERAGNELARRTSRRSFLGRLGRTVVAIAGGAIVAVALDPDRAEAHHICGHIFTTGSCPHPHGLPRIDARGFPLRSDGRAIDNLGRLVNGSGEPINEGGDVKLDPDGRPLPPAPRTRVCDEVSRKFGFKTWVDGGWFRCCGGEVRKLVDCCAYSSKRINGDRALEGYCFSNRKVFCVMYFQTRVPC
jgi:hypothetical protein